MLGTGFSRALFEDAPLAVDDYGLEELRAEFAQLPEVRRLLDLEASRSQDGSIDLERLMTRVDGPMPWESGRDQQLALLGAALRKRVVTRIEDARNGPRHPDDLRRFARTVLLGGHDCITFNYDDYLDEALWLVLTTRESVPAPYWHPDGGYGFYCRSAEAMIADESRSMDRLSSLRLKMHGSVNWRVRFGAAPPRSLENVTHLEYWLPLGSEAMLAAAGQVPSLDVAARRLIEHHLEAEPLIVPPIISKAALLREPVLRVVWRRAHELLLNAGRVIFIGYSLPLTDLATRYFLTEGLADLPTSCVSVVTRGQDDRLFERYCEVFPGIEASQFFADGALAWLQRLPDPPPSEIPAGYFDNDTIRNNRINANRKWHDTVFAR